MLKGPLDGVYMQCCSGIGLFFVSSEHQETAESHKPNILCGKQNVSQAFFFFFLNTFNYYPADLCKFDTYKKLDGRKKDKENYHFWMQDVYL